MQVLFQADIRQQAADVSIRSFYDSPLQLEDSEETPGQDLFMEQLVQGAMAGRTEIDALISGHSEHWRLERMPVVDRNILRMSVFEMTSVGTPSPVVIDEALELARRFSSEESVAFINGVLDAIVKRRQG